MKIKKEPIMEDIQKYLRLLGHKVRDIVTDVEGVVTSVTFDLYGCVQALVRVPPTKEMKEQDTAFWFDTKRLKVLTSRPVMPQPDFVAVPGGEHKPIPR